MLPSQENTTTEEWKFLTTEQSLEDVVFFANAFAKAGNTSLGSESLVTDKFTSGPNDLNTSDPLTTTDPLTLPLNPSTTPWIFLGGSYPGIRAALLRTRNPEVVFAAWASSAPVQAQVDMSSYYKAAERSLTRNCSSDWVGVTR